MTKPFLSVIFQMEKFCTKCICGHFCTYRHFIMDLEFLFPPRNDNYELLPLTQLAIRRIAEMVINVCTQLHQNALNSRMHKKNHLIKLSHAVKHVIQKLKSTKQVEEQSFPFCTCWINIPVSLSEFSTEATILHDFIKQIPVHLVPKYMQCIYSYIFPPKKYICTLLLAFHPLTFSVDFRFYMVDMINICKVKVNESFLLSIANTCPMLRKLCIPPFRLSEKGVCFLRRFHHLQWIDLRYSYEASPPTVGQLLIHLPKLIFLYYWMMAEVLDFLCEIKWPAAPYHLQYLCLKSPSKRHMHYVVNQLPDLCHLTLKESILKRYNNIDAPLTVDDLSVLQFCPNLTIHTWNIDW